MARGIAYFRGTLYARQERIAAIEGQARGRNSIGFQRGGGPAEKIFLDVRRDDADAEKADDAEGKDSQYDDPAIIHGGRSVYQDLLSRKQILLGAECGDGVNVGGAQCGSEAGEQGDQEDKRGRAKKGNGIVDGDAKQERAEAA